MNSNSFTKYDTSIAKGLAICMMLWLHLFGSPEKILSNVTIIPILNFGSLNLELKLTNLTIMCVPIFLFLSGYGIYLSTQNNMAIKVGKRFVGFLSQYWLCFAIFVPIGLTFYSKNPQYAWNFRTFFNNLFAIDWSYNFEWWFVQLYLIVILISPLIVLAVKKNSLLAFLLSFFIFLLPFDWLKNHHLAWGTDYTSILNRQFAFVLGAIAAKHDLFKQAVNKAPKCIIVKISLFFFVTLLILYVKKYLGMRLADPILAMPFIAAAIILFRNTFFGKALSFIGQYAVYIWLIHSFFCFYYWPKLTYWPRYSLLIFFWLLVLSIIPAILINKIGVSVRRNLE